MAADKPSRSDSIDEPMSIGRLAARTGVKVPTIRFYERIGLLPAPPRSEGNRRTYAADVVSRLRFIRHARELGFEVDAIRQLLAVDDAPHRPCAEIAAIARRHLESIELKLARLQILKAELQRMIDKGRRERVSGGERATMEPSARRAPGCI